MMSESNSETLPGDLSEMFGEMVKVDRVQQRECAGAKLAVCDMSYHQSSQRSESTRSHRTIRQTAIVLDADTLDLPQFALAPALKGVMGTIFAGLGGFGDIDFADSPEFSNSYSLHGWAEESMRGLFTPAIREHFAARPGWFVRGNGSRLIIFRQNQIYNDDERDRFVSDSLEIMFLFQEAEEQLDARPDIHRETRAGDVAATAARMGGLTGAMLQRQLRKVSVTRDELDSFLRTGPPRTIPQGLKRQVLGDNIPLIIIGAMFLVGGLVLGVVGVSLMEGIGRLVCVLILVVFPIIGLPIMGFTIRHRSRKRRVLRDGAIVEGTITKVKRTTTMVNNQMRYAVTVEYSAGGENQTTTCNAYSLAAEQACKLHESGKPVRLLVDPRDPNHAVCADLVMLFE